MTKTPSYSPILHCIYDEPEKRGTMGSGCHYSVFRAAEWFDVSGDPVEQAHMHDFAIIWDEDHDTRIIEAVERLYLAGLMFPIQYIGERKGTVAIILAAKFYWLMSDQYKKDVKRIMSDDLSMDSWTCEFGVFDKLLVDGVHPHQTDLRCLITDLENRVDTYIRCIDNLWNIGSRPYDYKPPHRFAGEDSPLG